MAHFERQVIEDEYGNGTVYERLVEATGAGRWEYLYRVNYERVYIARQLVREFNQSEREKAAAGLDATKSEEN